ncbi:MAG: CAP domain-containing protein, partial [Clostridium sp.]|nr:CAP domain-containing protein [Clostridium sp.]
LMESARVRAEEVSEYFSHTRPDGTSCLTAITLEYAAASENAACVYGDTLEKIAQDAVEGWCASPGHHIAILQSKWESTGVGVYVDGTEVSIVQLFIKNK